MEQGMSLLSALDSQIQVVVPFGHHWSLTSNNSLKCQQQTDNVFGMGNLPKPYSTCP